MNSRSKQQMYQSRPRACSKRAWAKVTFMFFRAAEDVTASVRGSDGPRRCSFANNHISSDSHGRSTRVRRGHCHSHFSHIVSGGGASVIAVVMAMLALSSRADGLGVFSMQVLFLLLVLPLVVFLPRVLARLRLVHEQRK